MPATGVREKDVQADENQTGLEEEILDRVCRPNRRGQKPQIIVACNQPGRLPGGSEKAHAGVECADQHDEGKRNQRQDDPEKPDAQGGLCAAPREPGDNGCPQTPEGGDHARPWLHAAETPGQKHDGCESMPGRKCPGQIAAVSRVRRRR